MNPRLLRLLEAFTVVVLLLASLAVVFLMLNPFQPLGVDFAPLWAAAVDPSKAYDIAQVTRIQSEAFGIQLGPRPFAYPPTALLLLIPAGQIPFWIAYAVFTAAGFAVFAWTAVRAGAPWWVVLFPPVVLLAHVGQPSLLVGGLILAGFFLKDWRVRGLLLGLALATKPQLCLFLPVALLLDRDWRTILLTAGIAVGLAAAATIVFGFEVWQQWLTAVADLRAVVLSSPSLSANMLHTNALLFVVPALLLLWFTRNAEVAVRFSATIGAALLVSPYAMNYELALLAPAVACLARKTPWMMIAGLLLGLGFFTYELVVLLLVLAAIVFASRSQATAQMG